MANYTYNNNQVNKKTDYKVKYFNLKDDGDEAIVRFNYSDSSEFEQVTVHTVKDGNFYRKVCCVNTNGVNPINTCPLCESGVRLDSRFFVKLINYIPDSNGNIIAQASVWDRPASFAKVLKSYIDEYGDLRNMIFKIKRQGAKGDKGTTYNILPTNATIYKDEIYKPDFSNFVDFDLKNHFYFEKTADEIRTYLTTGQFPPRVRETNQTTTPVTPVATTSNYVPPVQPSVVAMPYTVPNTSVQTPLNDPTIQAVQPSQTITNTRPRRYTF